MQDVKLRVGNDSIAGGYREVYIPRGEHPGYGLDQNREPHQFKEYTFITSQTHGTVALGDQVEGPTVKIIVDAAIARAREAVEERLGPHTVHEIGLIASG